MTFLEPAKLAPAPLADNISWMPMLGHDLRAAVADIIGGLRLIPYDGLDDGARVQLERIRASAEVMARLTEDGLSMAAGKEDLISARGEDVQLSQLLLDVEMRWGGRAREHGLGFVINIAADVPLILTLDRVALERFLSNTLSNALKYACAGVVRLDIQMSPSGALRVVVSDQGPGFPTQAIERLHDCGDQAERTRKSDPGLGLHIIQAMAARLGGRIKAENLAAGGALIALDIPPSALAIAEPALVTEGLPNLSHLKILLADDNATNRTLTAQMLTTLGARYEVAEDGVDAMLWLARETFDLALIDIDMPQINGLDVIRALRSASGGKRNMPIIAITAHIWRASQDTIYAAGANAILPKPMARLKTFGQTIRKVLEIHGGNGEPEAPAHRLTDAPCSGLDQLLTAAGPEVAPELVDRLSADLCRVECDLAAGLADNNVETVRACSHVLIALAGAVGAQPLLSLARTMNVAAQRRDSVVIASLGQDTLNHLDRLITFVVKETGPIGEVK